MADYLPHTYPQALSGGASSPAPVVTGLFNGVPSGRCLVYAESVVLGDGQHSSFVSASWSDWTRFAIFQETPERTPRLVLRDGRPVSCHGYLMGRWTNDDLSQQ